ncbi:MAG TPA: ABC transporter ATP-binding protein [Patescibacteria group bacterium]|nr:ABC transporter ATP-binding protein [Patescibacteria group bacterium]
MEPIIRIRHLSKKYKLGEWEKYVTLRDTLVNLLKLPFGLPRRQKNNGLSKGEFWALKDISFDVGRGEAIGIIGPNGAGKSTLLKILSRITTPTRGSATLGGRVGSLLEIGTGFHQELTGRENIYLNGAILGMRRREINKKFDEIVEFSGVERFLETPMKHYSTGMYMRLAFAVAAHLDPEILIVDEVLAVGDAEFQEKCLQKMDSIAKEEKRTVIFVSHNMEAVQKLCDRAILIDRGRIMVDGKVGAVVDAYLKRSQDTAKVSFTKRKDRWGTGQVKVTDIGFKDHKGKDIQNFKCGEDAEIDIEFKCFDSAIKEINFAIEIDSFYDRNKIARIDNKVLRKKISVKDSPIKIKLHKIPVLPGRYQFNVLVFGEEGEVYDCFPQAGVFNIDYGDFYHTGTMPIKGQGYLLLKYDID